MKDESNLHDARLGVDIYSRIINENVKEKETWRDMVTGTTELLLSFVHEPACRDAPYLRSLLTNAVTCVLNETKSLFVDSDYARETELVRNTKSALAKAISDIQEEVDHCHPEGGDKLTTEQWLKIRKEEGQRIDPETAEVTWSHTYFTDPYGVYQDLSEEEQCIGRSYFARSPRSDIWVSFCDLPDETGKQLWERYKSELAFPAGLESLPW